MEKFIDKPDFIKENIGYADKMTGVRGQQTFHDCCPNYAIIKHIVQTSTGTSPYQRETIHHHDLQGV
jgi:hypothetical protein